MSVRIIAAALTAVAALSLASVLHAQDLPYRDRLYFACKVWGLVKYNHPSVTSCSVDWNPVLSRVLPSIKSAASKGEFNDALLSMLSAAGPTPIADDTLPYILPELRRNRDFAWLSDAALRQDVRAVLDTIVVNARPGNNCWVGKDPTGASYLIFPHDSPVLDLDARGSFPDEFQRLQAVIAYWNILDVFNPNRHILDAPWDSTLRRNILSVADAGDYSAFYAAFRLFTAALNDAHVEGMTRSILYQNIVYSPKLVLVHTADGYAVLKSGIAEVVPGDLLLSVGGRSVKDWEDTLRGFISAGNDAVFHCTMCTELLRGTYYSSIDMTFRDVNGTERSYSGLRNVAQSTSWFLDVYPNDTLAAVKWKKWGCNVGYVHMGNLTTGDVDAMVTGLRGASAIIFDVRNYPQGAVTSIADKILPDRLPAVELLLPDTTYPGTFTRTIQYFGRQGNPSPYNGRVIILCDEQTQSHAEWTCMILRAMPGAVIVGGPTAGADGSVTKIRFTRDINTGFTSLGVYRPGGGNTQRTGIVPDSLVIPTAMDIRGRRDPALEKALQIAGCPVAGIRDDPSVSSPGSKLEQNFPNPFTPFTSVSYSLSRPGYARLRVLDLLGRNVLTLVDGFHDAGRHSLNLEGSSIAGGTYVYTLEAEGIVLYRTMTILK